MHKNGINLHATKIRAIESPKGCKHVKSFIEKVSYIRKFIPKLTELLETFYKLF